ncbi:type II toxin-antitoxin system VapC family toxin [Corynebacterium glyciniphilum]|uniref:type II toxin-antitoxin system VapC family toxin n=1 Tax=Corynebacterium glyciniphilum TaxID=1404244 RepID=UPI003FD2A45D
MKYLLDTNILSDARKQARPALTAWLAAQPRADLAISVVSLLELERSVLRLKRRGPVSGAHLHAWLTIDVPTAFAGTMLPIGERIARRAARLHVRDPMPEMDALVATTATVHSLTLVTRNTKDFRRADIDLLDPWAL